MRNIDGCLLHNSHWGLSPNPRHVSWLGMERHPPGAWEDVTTLSQLSYTSWANTYFLISALLSFLLLWELIKYIHQYTQYWEEEYKRCHLKVECELPSQRNCLAPLAPQTFGMLTPGTIAFALGLKQQCIPNNCLQRYQESRHSDYQTENSRHSLKSASLG